MSEPVRWVHYNLYRPEKLWDVLRKQNFNLTYVFTFPLPYTATPLGCHVSLETTTVISPTVQFSKTLFRYVKVGIAMDLPCIFVLHAFVKVYTRPVLLVESSKDRSDISKRVGIYISRELTAMIWDWQLVESFENWFVSRGRYTEYFNDYLACEWPWLFLKPLNCPNSCVRICWIYYTSFNKRYWYPPPRSCPYLR